MLSLSEIEHFALVDENNRYFYYASTNGYILRVLKSTYDERKVKPYTKNNHIRKGNAPTLYVKINQREIKLKKVIAKAFIKNYDNSKSILHKNGDFKNCSLSNLLILTKQEAEKRQAGIIQNQLN